MSWIWEQAASEAVGDTGTALTRGMIQRLKSWPLRIPQAIEKAEGLVLRSDFRRSNVTSEVFITTTEVALAKAAYDLWYDSDRDTDEPLAALVSFVEKVENL